MVAVVSFLVVFTSLFGIIPESTQTGPFTMIWEVRQGTNRQSCLPLQKAGELGKIVKHMSWHRFQGDSALPPWVWIGGVKYPGNQVEVQKESGHSHERYSLDRSGIFEIQNVTEEDNDDLYRCSVLDVNGWGDSLHYKLHFFDPDEAQNNYCPVINSTNCTGANLPCQVNETTDTPSLDSKCAIWKIVTAILSLAVFVLVLFQSYPLCRRCFQHILFNARRSHCVENAIVAVDSANADINSKEESDNERNVAYEGADERDLHYGVEENNDNNRNVVPGNGAGEL